jgi:hypothetical protein
MSDFQFAFIMFLLLAYGIFGMVCSITCAIHAIKKGPSTWYTVAGWVVVVNVALTFIGGILAQ